ncbi:MAG: ATP-binding cassette domain-containing protein [Treponema sp.]|nr:ATP-binding cassette domain-containing protein [Treponema sp.]MCL2237184.1 ATP-binding cassette domain-containing protein [Treponema sp.]
MNRDIAIKFESVSFSYSDTDVLKSASFHIHCGEFVAMVGPNGSGKTTVLKLLFGLEKPNKGNVFICDSTAYVSQHMPADNLFPITVRDVVRMGLLHPQKRYSNAVAFVSVAEALEKTGIADLASRPYRSLSGGQKRRALVARALAAKPRLLVLDEPTANMDAESETRLYETLGAYKGNTTILIVTHDTEFVTSLTDRVLCLGNGKKIVQHGLETNVLTGHGDEKHSKVLHGEDITCC